MRVARCGNATADARLWSATTACARSRSDRTVLDYLHSATAASADLYPASTAHAEQRAATTFHHRLRALGAVSIELGPATTAPTRSQVAIITWYRPWGCKSPYRPVAAAVCSWQLNSGKNHSLGCEV